MPQTIIYLDEERNKKVEFHAKKYSLSKADSILDIIDEFDESKCVPTQEDN